MAHDEPPTINEFEQELRNLPSSISISDQTSINIYTGDRPKKKETTSNDGLKTVLIVVVIIFVLLGVSIYYFLCRADSDHLEQLEEREN